MCERDALDFSGVFKLETLVQMEVEASCYCEVGQRKMIAVGGAKGLEFLEITKAGDTIQKTREWDCTKDPMRSMCFEPTATWLLIVSDCNLSLIPFLPFIEPEADYDHRWSLTEPTVIPFTSEGAVTVAWWHTMESDNIAIIAMKCGKIVFYSLDLTVIMAETKVQHELVHIQISADDSLDVLALLITGTDRHQWKLVLEHRSVKYNWLRDGTKPSVESRDKKDGLMGYIKEKITNLSQSSSTEKVNVVEYSRAPTTYLPSYRQHISDWSVTVQYAKGGHFVSAFDVKSGMIVLESTEVDTPSLKMLVSLKKDEHYRQALWSDKVLYLLTDNAVEVHSSKFAVKSHSDRLTFEELGLMCTHCETCLWRVELPGVLHRVFLMSPHAGHRRQPSGWEPPTFLCDLQLPRFQLDGCLVLGSKGAYVLGTMVDPCEWLVGTIVREGQAAKAEPDRYTVARHADALGAPVDTLIKSSVDMLLSRSKLEPAKYLYDLTKGSKDGWVIRLGMFDFLEQLANFKSSSNDDSTVLDIAPALVRALTQLMYLVVNPAVTKGALDILTPLPTAWNLFEACTMAASLGLWDALSVFSVHRGISMLAILAISQREFVCLGALRYILNQKFLTMYLLKFNVEFLHTHLILNVRSLDTKMLKRFCIFMSPLHEQLRPVMRNLKDGIHNTYTNRLETLIACFMRIVCEIDAREPTPRSYFAPKQEAEVFKESFTPRRTISCGLMHWAMSDEGDAITMNVGIKIETDLIGRVVTVACGRHHTIVLTENGVYAAGDNSHGQLGTGSAWEGGKGEDAAVDGELMFVQASWDVRVVTVTAGHYHSVAVDAGGRLYTWGWGVHGQLGLGDTYDALTPQLVTRLQGRKVLQVGCGACHTTVLLRNGEVWAFGASMFGQLGSGNREKSSLPVRVVLMPPDDPVRSIAVGYFHTLAVTSKGELWTWGASPQCVRSTNNIRRARRRDDDSAANVHLAPTPVDTRNVRGTILQISAGWHHSCLLTHLGFIYTWGLNFDGQLGSGGTSRKQVAIPTQIEIPPETKVDDACTEEQVNVASAADALAPRPEWTAKSLVACGGDFTVCLNDYGKIYIAGNTHTEDDTKCQRVIMMKTTRRIIKIPTSKLSEFRFQFIDKIDNLLVGSGDQRDMIPMTKNPVAKLSDFERHTWVDEIIHVLKPWINKKITARNPNVASKLAYHNQKYAFCLKLQLKSLKTAKRFKEPMNANNLHSSREHKHKTDKAGYIIAKIKGRIKEIGKAFLNEKPFPEFARSHAPLYTSLPCYCVEAAEDTPVDAPDLSEESNENLASKAAQIVDDCLKTFPVCYEAWDGYLQCAKKYFTQNDLPGDELEAVLNKYLAENSSLVGCAVLLSDTCANSERLFTPTFLLRLCQDLFEVPC